MALRVNRADSSEISNGTVVTAALSATAGDGFSGSAGAGGSRVFSTEQRTSGSYSYKLTTVTGNSTILVWSGYASTMLSASFDFYLTDLPSVTSEISVVYDNNASIIGRVTILANGNVGIMEAAGGIVSTLTTGLTADTWYRLEYAIGVGSGNGIIRVAVYPQASTTAIASYDNSARNTGTNPIDNIQFGKPVGNSSSPYTIYLDGLRADDTTTTLLGQDQLITSKVMYTWTGTVWAPVQLHYYNGSSWRPIEE